MKREYSVRAGVVLQLTLIAVASLSLQAVFALKVIEITLERRLSEAAVSVAEVVRRAVEAGGRGPEASRSSEAIAFTIRSSYIRDVEFLADGPPGGLTAVAPVGGRTAGFLSVHSTVDVILPVSMEGGGSRGIRVRYFSPGAESEARHLAAVAGVLVGADVLIFVLFGIFLMDRSVVRPIRRLVAVTEKIAAGDYGLRADEVPRNELGQLGGSFNRMIGSILFAQEKLRHAEQDSFRTEKLATVGRLAAGVAHEVGNPLMAIRGYAEYLQKNPAGAEEREECLGKIVAETRKIENIVRGLLTVASPGRREDENADINAVVRETVELLSFRKMFRDIEVRVECGDVGRVGLGPGRIQQVLLNLLLNAVDAMESRGELRVRTFRTEPWFPPSSRTVRRRATDPPDADVLPLRGERVARGQRGVAVSISDTGSGIRPENLKNIFDPFFTTKEPGKGTGLGLSVSRAIVEAADGEILAESEEGKGATFTVIFPAREGGEAARAAGEGKDG